jgi:hypothetical protein
MKFRICLFSFFFLLVQCQSTSGGYSEYSQRDIQAEEVWSAYVEVFGKYFTIESIHKEARTLVSKPKIQILGLDSGQILRARRTAYTKVEDREEKVFYGLRIVLEVDQSTPLSVEPEELLRLAKSTWNPEEFHEYLPNAKDSFRPNWVSIGEDDELEKRILDEIKERIRPKLDN